MTSPLSSSKPSWSSAVSPRMGEEEGGASGSPAGAAVEPHPARSRSAQPAAAAAMARDIRIPFPSSAGRCRNARAEKASPTSRRRSAGGMRGAFRCTLPSGPPGGEERIGRPGEQREAEQKERARHRQQEHRVQENAAEERPPARGAEPEADGEEE